MNALRISIAAALLGLAPAASFAATTPIGSWEPAVGRAATRALNLLEAKGYADFRNFAVDGNDFTATVTRRDHPETLIVDPDGGTIQAAR